MRRLLLLCLLLLLLLTRAPAWGAPAWGAPAWGAPGVVWAPGPVLDQGPAPACVGYALAGWLTSAPGPLAREAPSGGQIYAAARARDGIPGPHSGTTVEAGLNALQAAGYVAAWHRAPDVASAAAWLTSRGPILMSGRFQGSALPDGTLPLPLAGDFYHAWYCYGVAGGEWLCSNSWGGGWNREGGRFRLHSAAVAAWLPIGGDSIDLASKDDRYFEYFTYWKGLTPR